MRCTFIARVPFFSASIGHPCQPVPASGAVEDTSVACICPASGRWRAAASCWIALALLLPVAVRAAEAVSADPPAIADDIAQLLQDRNYAAADAVIEQTLAKPDGPRDYLLYLKGRALLLQRQFDAAIGAFEQLGQDFPDSPWNRRARFAIGLAAAAKQDFARAATIYRTEAESLLALPRKQELAGVLLEFGDAYYHPPKTTDPPDYAAALPFYEEALQVGLLPAKQAETQFRVARCRQELQEHVRAAELFAAWFADHPEEPLALEAAYRAGQCWLAGEQPKPARRVWQDLWTAHADSPSPWIAEAGYELSRTWGLPEPATDVDLELGVAALEDFLEKFPMHPRAPQAHVDIAASYLTRGRHADAVRQLTVLLADPRQAADEAIPAARVHLGQAYREQTLFAEAVQAWREYLSLHPADVQWSDVQQRVVDAEYLLGVQKYQAQDYAAAKAGLSEFLAKYPLDPRNPGILVLFGQMSYDQQRWDEALVDWQRVASKHPHTNEAAYAQYRIGAVTERELGRPSEALAAYAKVTRGKHVAQARAAIARLAAPSLTVITERVFRSHEPPAVKLITRNIPAVSVRVYRIDPEAYFRKSHRLDGIEQLDIALIAPDATFEFPVPDYAEHVEFENIIPLPQPELAAGALVVTVGNDTLEATTLVLHSDLDVIVKASRSEVLVLAQNMQTGKPWPGVRLLISDGQAIRAETVTGDDGVCQWNPSHGATPRAAADVERPESDPFTDTSSPALPGAKVAVLALADGHVASQGVSLDGLRVAAAVTDSGYLYTDRPAYQAGQRVFVRGCIRTVGSDANPFGAGPGRTLEVLDPRGQRVWQQPVVLGKFHTLAADFPLPPMGVSGEYRIAVCDAVGRRHEGTFQVREHRPEPVRVQIEPARRVVYRGESLEGTIRVTFPDGTPLQGAQLVYHLADEPARTALTDERGGATFALSTREFGQDQVLTVTAKLLQWNVTAEANVQFALRGFSVDVRTLRSKFVAGEAFDVLVSTRDPEGSPVAQPLKLRVFELLSDRGRVNERPQGEHDLQTAAADGMGRATLKLDQGGRYRIRVEGADSRNQACFGQTTVVVSGDHDRRRLLILADRRNYRVGETAEVNLYWRETPALALVTFEGSRVFGYRLVPLATGANKLALPMTAELSPNFELAVAVMTKAARFYQASCPFTVENDLQVSLDVRRQDGTTGCSAPGEPFEAMVAATGGLTPLRSPRAVPGEPLDVVGAATGGADAPPLAKGGARRTAGSDSDHGRFARQTGRCGSEPGPGRASPVAAVSRGPAADSGRLSWLVANVGRADRFQRGLCLSAANVFRGYDRRGRVCADRRQRFAGSVVPGGRRLFRPAVRRAAVGGHFVRAARSLDGTEQRIGRRRGRRFVAAGHRRRGLRHRRATRHIGWRNRPRGPPRRPVRTFLCKQHLPRVRIRDGLLESGPGHRRGRPRPRRDCFAGPTRGVEAGGPRHYHRTAGRRCDGRGRGDKGAVRAVEAAVRLDRRRRSGCGRGGL